MTAPCSVLLMAPSRNSRSTRSRTVITEWRREPASAGDSGGAGDSGSAGSAGRRTGCRRRRRGGVRAPSTSRPCPSRISKFPHNLAQHPDDFSPTAPPTTTTMIDRDATARKTRGSMAGTLRASPFRDSVPSLDSGRPRQLARARALVRPGRRLGAPGRRSPLRSASGMRKRRESASRPLRTRRASPSA